MRGSLGNLGSYYEMARDSDLITSVGLLLWRKRQFGKRAIGRPLLELLEEGEARLRLGQLSLDDICTPGLPQEEAWRYYSS